MKLQWIGLLCLLHFSYAETVQDLQDLLEVETKVRQVAEKCVPLTVALVASDASSSGSGVIASEDGLILTAAHVVQGNDTMDVVFPNGKTLKGKVLGANYAKDLAMVRMEAEGKGMAAPRGVSKSLEVGDWVVATGHAGGFDPARTPPVRFGRVVSKGPGNFFTTDCTLIGGDSGGPIFDLNGNIVGINSNIGQKLKINNHAGVDGFKDDWERMLAGEQWGTLELDPLQNEEMPVLGLAIGMSRAGLVVGEVSPGSKATIAGIQPGDLIVSLEDQPIRNLDDLRNELLRKQVGDKVKLVVRRDRRELVKEVELVRRADAK
ncbi:MAG: S1C family serine protease [Akkermansiaceae bacterium]